MLKTTDMLHSSNFNHYYYYGEKQLPAINLNTKYGEIDLSKIDWDKVKRIKGMACDFYDYGHAIQQLTGGTGGVNFVAYLLDKIGYVSDFSVEDNILYMYVKMK